MIAIIKRPGQPAVSQEVENSLKALQNLVGGYIETVSLPHGICMIVNEEGKLQGLQPNFRLDHDLIVGTAVFVGVSGEDFCSLSVVQENTVWRMMSWVLT